MKSQMDYKTKRNIIIIAVIVVLFIVASIGSFIYFKGNSDSEAKSLADSQEGSSTEQGQEQTDNKDNKDNNGTDDNKNNENETNKDATDANTENNNETQPVTNNGTNTTTNVADNDEETRTETVTKTETVETTETVVGFIPDDINVNVSLSSNLPELDKKLEAVTEVESEYVAPQKEITYKITVKNNSKDNLEKMNISTVVPEGTELVQDSISDEGTLTDGKIAWKVDVNTEKQVTFKVKVLKDSGTIEESAIVNGKATNTVSNVIDEVPVITLVDSDPYTLEVREQEYQEKGYFANDAIDGDITDKVVVTYSFKAMNSEDWVEVDAVDTTVLGTYKITYTVTDSIGNTVSATREVTIIDTVNPSYNCIEIKNIDQRTPGYAKAGDRIWVYFYVNEHLSEEPTITINGVKAKIVQREDGADFNDIWYKYVGEVVMTEEMEEELITFTINGYKDLAGNEGAELTNDNINYGDVTDILLDHTAPAIKFDNIVDGVIKKGTSKTITDANPFEEVITNEKGEVKNRSNGDKQENGTYKKRFNIGWLGEGTFTVTATDAAGNETKKTFTVDGTAPKAEAVEIKHGNEVRTPGYAKVGDKIWVLVSFREKLGKDPVITINGAKAENITIPYKDEARNYYQYMGEVEMTEEMEEGEIQFTIEGYEDAVGNVGEKLDNGDINYGEPRKIIFDKTAPEIKFDNIVDGVIKKGTSKTITDANPFEEVITNEKGEVKNRANGDKQENGTYKKRFNIGWLGEGTFTVTATDAAGNEAKKTFTVDGTAPKAEAVEIKHGNEVRTPGYAKVGDKIWVLVSFREKLGKDPVITINGVKAENITIPYKDEARNYYQYMGEVEMTEEMEEGEIQFTVEGYEDAVGNVGEKLDNEDINYGEPRKIIFDKTAPKANYVGIMNIDKVTEGYAKVGDRIWVYVTLNEKLSEEPIIKINDVEAKIVQREDGTKNKQEWYKYVGEVVMTEDMKEGEIQFTINGYEDLAGNKGEELTNANINHGNLDGIKLDKSKPEKVYVRISSLKPTTPGYVKVGDKVWVELRTNEYLSNEPKIKINGVVAKKAQEAFGEKWNASWYSYIGEVEMTDDMEAGEVQIEISGYKDLAGNEGVTLTNKDIENGASIILDKEKPTVSVEYSPNAKTSTKGNVIVTLTASEEIIIDSSWESIGDNKYRKVYEENVDNEEVTFTDLAGNKGSVKVTISNIDREAAIVYLNDEKGMTKKTYNNETAEADKSKTYEDYGATAEDNLDGKVTIKEATSISYNPQDGIAADKSVDEVDLKVLGEYTLKYSYTDKAGNESSPARRVVTVQDKTKPTITLKGKKEETVLTSKVTEYVDEGITVEDNLYEEEDITIDTKITFGGKEVSKVDMSKPGTYTITYTATDKSNNSSTATRTVIVKDDEAPTIYLKGVEGKLSEAEETIEADKTATYKDKGAEGVDNIDGPFTIDEATECNGVKDGKVDMGKPGKYVLKYTYTDKAGNSATATRTVLVKDRTAPVIKLNVDENYEKNVIYLEAGVDKYIELGAEYTDNVDDDVTVSPTRINYYKDEKKFTKEVDKVDTTKPGLYKVSYACSDKAGNAGVNSSNKNSNSILRLVYVRDTTRPTLELIGPGKITLNVGDEYTEQGVLFKDIVDGEKIVYPTLINYYPLEGSRQSVKEVDTNKPGTYKLSYACTDEAGNPGERTTSKGVKTTTIVRTVIVKEE